MHGFLFVCECVCDCVLCGYESDVIDIINRCWIYSYSKQSGAHKYRQYFFNLPRKTDPLSCSLKKTNIYLLIQYLYQKNQQIVKNKHNVV